MVEVGHLDRVLVGRDGGGHHYLGAYQFPVDISEKSNTFSTIFLAHFIHFMRVRISKLPLSSMKIDKLAKSLFEQKNKFLGIRMFEFFALIRFVHI